MNNRTEKSSIVASLLEKFKQYNCFYVIDATKLSVSAINQFKRSCHRAGVGYKVAKNTLVLRAIAESPNVSSLYETLRDQVLKGFSGILFFDQDASIPAKLIKDFRNTQRIDRPILKGAYVDGDLFLGNNQLETLSRYKSKQVLIGEIINLLQSPTSRILAALQNHVRKTAVQSAAE